MNEHSFARSDRRRANERILRREFYSHAKPGNTNVFGCRVVLS